MDYRHTEDYARRMETAGLRAQQLRQEAIEQFWAAAARWLRSLWRTALKSKTPAL